MVFCLQHKKKTVATSFLLEIPGQEIFQIDIEISSLNAFVCRFWMPSIPILFWHGTRQLTAVQQDSLSVGGILSHSSCSIRPWVNIRAGELAPGGLLPDWSFLRSRCSASWDAFRVHYGAVSLLLWTDGQETESITFPRTKNEAGINPPSVGQKSPACFVGITSSETPKYYSCFKMFACMTQNEWSIFPWSQEMCTGIMEEWI